MDNVSHFEIPFDNGDRARNFYAKVFGWGINYMPEMQYTIVSTGRTDKKGMLKEIGVINGGMMKRSSKVKNPVITIIVKDIDEKIKEVKKHGGKLVVAKMEIPKMGYAAYVKDSEGNIIGLFQNL